MTRLTFKGSAVRTRALAAGYRSGLEETIAADLTARGISFKFEKMKIAYVKPESEHRYTPDFELPNSIIIESKGRFITADRKKHLLVKQQHPHYDIRFVFSNPHTRISKKSATTYAMWCDKHGFLYAAKRVPDAWLKEGT